MSLSEFALIKQYFSSVGGAEGVALGVGDDGAVLDISPDQQLVVSVDTLVAGVHFPQDAAPEDIARRTLRVNLSDMAAMGADARWFTLALTLPQAEADWLQAFSKAMAEDAQYFGCALVGGDTTAGPLSISIQMMGTVPRGQALVRGGAQAGDGVYVTGTLGEGAAALQVFSSGCSYNDSQREALLKRFNRPEPRLTVGRKLRGVASAAIDISDGLLADLGHIAECSGLGAELQLQQVPVAPWLTEAVNPDQLQSWVLSGGDDYELCFTVPESKQSLVDGMIHRGELLATRIGLMTSEPGIVCLDAEGQVQTVARKGYQHFN